MSTVLFNSTAIYNTIGSGAANNLFIGASTANNLLSGGSAAGDCILTIYKGAIPDANGFLDRTVRDSDVLINFNLPAYNTASPPIGSGYRLPYTAGVSTSVKLLVGISQTNSVATQSGLATWFWLGRNTSLNSMANNVFIIGTVGRTSDVADLEIPDNNIIAGQEYKSVGCYLTLPFKFEI